MGGGSCGWNHKLCARASIFQHLDRPHRKGVACARCNTRTCVGRDVHGCCCHRGLCKRSRMSRVPYGHSRRLCHVDGPCRFDQRSESRQHQGVLEDDEEFPRREEVRIGGARTCLCCLRSPGRVLGIWAEAVGPRRRSVAGGRSGRPSHRLQRRRHLALPGRRRCLEWADTRGPPRCREAGAAECLADRVIPCR